MNQNFQNQPNRRLHSPLLDGYLKTENLKSSLKEKSIMPKVNKPQSQVLDYNKQKNTDDTLEEVFSSRTPLDNISVDIIKQDSIDNLDNAFKMAGIFIVAMGSVLSLLQIIIIGNGLYNGNYALGSSILVLCAVVFGTILANSICIGFVHMIKMTRFIHADLLDQKNKMNEILSYYNRVNYKSKT